MCDVDRLQDIQQEMLSLLEEARDIIQSSGENWAYERARSYWLAHVEMGLTNDHGYVGRSMCSMEDTISDLSEENEGYWEGDS